MNPTEVIQDFTANIGNFTDRVFDRTVTDEIRQLFAAMAELGMNELEIALS